MNVRESTFTLDRESMSLLPPKPDHSKPYGCCAIIVGIALSILGIINLKGESVGSSQVQTIVGWSAIGVASCCFICIAALAINTCLKTKEKRGVTYTHVALPV